MQQSRAARSAEAGSVPPRQIAGTVLLGAAMLLAFGLGLSTIHDQSRDALDEQMGERLVLLALEAASLVEPDSLLVWSLQEKEMIPLATRPLLRRWLDLSDRRDLNYLVLYSFDREILLDTSGLRALRAEDPYLFDTTPLDLALDGAALHTSTQDVASEYLKTAFAPVRGEDGRVEGAVAVQALPDFFDTVRDLRKTLAFVGIGVTVLVAVLIALYIYYARRLAAARAALVRGETLSAMGRMAAGIAHEIRNPLGIIKNSAQLLRIELEDEGHDTSLVDFIPVEVDRLNETLTGYLEFAKDAPLRREEVDLTALAQRTLRLVGRDLEAADVVRTDNLATVGRAPAYVDPRRLQQVLLNFLLNAIQAMPEGGTLDVRLRQDASMWRLAVQDSGTGMDASTASEVFEPFVTTKEKGSGLGLHVARRIVEDHGGHIELETAPGAGSTFTVVLPRSAAPTPSEET